MKLDLDTWIARLIWLSFFLPAQIQTIILIAWSVWMLIRGIQEKMKFPRHILMACFFLGLGYWFYLVWLPFTDQMDRHIIYSFLERKVSMLFLPIVVYISCQTGKDLLYKEMSWFVWGVLLKFVWTNIFILQAGLLHPDIFKQHVLYRDSFNELAQIHPTYFGIYLVFAMAILIWRGKEICRKMFWLSPVLQGLLVVFLLILSPKTPMIAALVIYSLAFLRMNSISLQRKLMLFVGFIFLFIVSWFSIPFFQDRMIEVTEFVHKKQEVRIESSMEVRSLIFKTDIELLKNHWLIGLGPAQLEAKLNTCFFIYSMYLKKSIGSYNTHNEWLNQWLCFGLVGIIYFVSVFYFHAKRAIQQANFLYMSFLIIFIMSCFTENVLSRQHGIIFFTLVGALFFLKENKSSIQRAN